MTTLEQFVSPVLMRALGWTLLHSLWQGALVAAVLAGALLLLRRQRAEVRYAASAGALGVVVALAGITFGLYFNAGPAQGVLLSPGTVKTPPVAPLKQAETPAAGVSPASQEPGEKEFGKAVAATSNGALGQVAAAAASPVAPAFTSGWLATGLRYFDNHLPLLVVAWLLGLLAMSLRMLGGLLYVQRLRRYRVRPLSAVWQERLAALAARSGVQRPVALLESALVQVPLVVGHLRPVILLPLGTVAGLSPACLEAILAHELAHVLRRDYLVNLLQTVAEVLFFYHPAVWFMANCVRTERENCCDDTATALVGGDPLRLARALTALAEWSQSAVVPAAPRLALAAMNRPGALLLRVRRLVQRRPAAPTLGEGLLAGVLMLGGLGLLGSSVALAGPLAATSHSAKLLVFDWQTGPTPPAKAAAVADTNKRAARVAPVAPVVPAAPLAPTAPLAPEAAVAPVPPVEELREEVMLERRNDGDRNENDPRDGRPGRRERRVIVNGRANGPMSLPGNPGTVVITKDKKGRLTDLVVNGQRVETATGKGKNGKPGKGQQVEVVQVAPFGGADVRSFAFRTDGGGLDPQVRREVERTVRRELTRDVQRNAERDVQRNIDRSYDFQFDFPTFGDHVDKSFRMAPGSSLNRVYSLKSLSNGGGSDPESRRATINALRGAERGLRTAATAKGLNAGQRKEINKELEKVRAQIKKAESMPATSQLQRLNGGLNMNPDMREHDQQMREHEQDMREHDQQMREHQRDMQEHRRELQERIRESQQELQNLEQERTQSDRDRSLAERDRERADQDRERAGRDRTQAERDRTQADRDRADRDRERADRDRKRSEALIDQLQKDGLIQDKDNFQLRLTPNSLTVNGKEQPAKLRDKYLKLHAEASGRPLMGTNSMVINRNSDSSTSFSQSEGPRLPRPPRAPRAPMAVPPVPPAPAMGALPAPPRPPRIDASALRGELRKDGVLAADEKNMQFQLNASGLTVNGKKQPDELAAKYRKMTGHADDKNYNVTISTQED